MDLSVTAHRAVRIDKNAQCLVLPFFYLPFHDRIERVKYDRKEVEKDVEVDFESSNEVRGIKSSIKDVFEVEVEVEVKEINLSLLQVLDVQLYGMIINLSPGEFQIIKLSYFDNIRLFYSI